MGYSEKQPGKWAAAGSVPLHVAERCRSDTDASLDHLYYGEKLALTPEVLSALLYPAISESLELVKDGGLIIESDSRPKGINSDLAAQMLVSDVVTAVFPSEPDATRLRLNAPPLTVQEIGA